MEEEKTNSEAPGGVNVYIKLDSSDLERIKARHTRRKQSHKRHFTKAFRCSLEDCNLRTNFLFLLSWSGLLLIVEMILCIILIIIVSGHSIYIVQTVGVTMNSATLLASILHLVVMVTGVVELPRSHSLIHKVQMLKNISLLLLQMVAFAVYVSAWDPPVATAVITTFVCCALILSIFCSDAEHTFRESEKVDEVEKSREKGGIQVSYERLQHH